MVRVRHAKSSSLKKVFVGCALGVYACVIGCSTGKSAEPMCSTTKSLLRFETPNAPLTLKNSQYFSNGGFLEVNTRKDQFGAIDSSRICTAYVEFSDSPAESEAVLNSEALSMNVYTAAHCLDMSKDHSMKLHLFDAGESSVYYPVVVSYSALDKVQNLRRVMRQKKLPVETQKRVLNAFRPSAANVEDLFNQPATTSEKTGDGPSQNAASICLKKDDPEFQHVCATYHDLVVLKVEPHASNPQAVVERLKKIRENANIRLRKLIGDSKLAARFAKEPSFRMSFSDSTDNPLDLIGVHKAVRQRVHTYSKFKMLKFVHDELAQPLKACAGDKRDPLCGLFPEISQVIQAALRGTAFENFDPAQLPSIVDVMKPEYSGSARRMDAVFSIFDKLLVDNQNALLSLPFDARLQSNFRFVNHTASVEDRPDPADVSRAFMVLHSNNLTGDESGNHTFFIKWNPETQLGRFSYLKISRKFTDQMRAQAAAKSTPTQTVAPNVGHLQEGDSGSIMVIEHLPYFAITSVDGKATSGGATIRPLPEPIEDEADLASNSSANSRTTKLCK